MTRYSYERKRKSIANIRATVPPMDSIGSSCNFVKIIFAYTSAIRSKACRTVRERFSYVTMKDGECSSLATSVFASSGSYIPRFRTPQMEKQSGMSSIRFQGNFRTYGRTERGRGDLFYTMHFMYYCVTKRSELETLVRVNISFPFSYVSSIFFIHRLI